MYKYLVQRYKLHAVASYSGNFMQNLQKNFALYKVISCCMCRYFCQRDPRIS